MEDVFPPIFERVAEAGFGFIGYNSHHICFYRSGDHDSDGVEYEQSIAARICDGIGCA